MNEKMMFAERLKEARQKADISQAELSRRTGISPATLSTYEKGKTPPIDKALQIAQALSVSLDWLCGNEPVPTPKKNVANFGIDDYLKSLATMLFEMTTEMDFQGKEGKAVITINCRKVAYFCKRVVDLLQVYRGGLLTDEMYVSCIDKLIAEFDGYHFAFGNVISTTEYFNIEDQLFHFIDANYDESPAGVIITTIMNDTGARKISILLSNDEYQKRTTPIES